ncbi:hypothetical protein VNO77_42007 [Canavalia gladiata]|uniref:Uncharacterized protein n=1 Tax=Canavalia gladiata TaxID=3824 RepID=A0AAN9PSZ8_CANGL
MNFFNDSFNRSIRASKYSSVSMPYGVINPSSDVEIYEDLFEALASKLVLGNVGRHVVYQEKTSKGAQELQEILEENLRPLSVFLWFLLFSLVSAASQEFSLLLPILSISVKLLKTSLSQKGTCSHPGGEGDKGDRGFIAYIIQILPNFRRLSS